jgi:ankyrin repeat protein
LLFALNRYFVDDIISCLIENNLYIQIMKKLSIKCKSLYSMIYLLLSLSLNLNAGYLPGDWLPAPQLGHAYHSHKFKTFAVKCVQADKIEVNQEVDDLKYRNEVSFESIVQAVRGSPEEGNSVPFVKAGNIKYAEQNATTDHRMNWFLEFQATPKSLSFDLDTLKVSAFGKEMLANPLDLMNRCGNEFVYQIDLGIKLIATLSLEFASKEDKEAFNAELLIGVDDEENKVTLNGNLNAIKQRMGSRTTLKIEAYQTGGNPKSLEAIIKKSVIECKLSTIESCLETFDKVLKYARKDFLEELNNEKSFKPIRYHTLPYEESQAFELVPANGFPMLDNLVQLKRDELEENYKTQALVYNRAHYLKTKLENFIEKEQLLKIEEIYKKSFSNIKKLTNTMTVCLERSLEECLNLPTDLLIYDFNDLEVKIAHKTLKNIPKNSILPLKIAPINVPEVEIDAKNSAGLTSIQTAVSTGQLKMVHTLVAQGANHEIVDKNANTLLHLAAKNGDVPLIKYLKDEIGLNVHAQNKEGLTPLQIAAAHGHLQAVQTLIARGGNKQILDKHDNTLLHLAAKSGDVALIKYLSESAKVEVNAQNKECLTALQIAVMGAQLKAIRELIACGANKKILDKCDNTLLHLAVKVHDIALIYYLINEVKLSVDAQNKEGLTPLQIAVMGGQLYIVQALIGLRANHKILDKQGSTLLHLAAEVGDITLINYLVDDAKLALEINDKKGLTVLQTAVMRGQLSIVHALIQRGANDKILDKSGSTLLHLATEVGDIALINYLIDEAKLAVNAQDKEGVTPLYKALYSNNLKIVNILLAKGADGTIKDKEGKTALHWGIKNEEMAEKLLDSYELPINCRTLMGNGYINHLSFSPKEAILAAPVNNINACIYLWNINSGSIIRTFGAEVPTCNITNLSFSPDGSILASGSRDKTIKLWDPNTGTIIRTLVHGVTTLVVFSPDGTMLASAGFDELTANEFKLWGQKRYIINHSIKLWNVHTGVLIHEFKVTKPYYSAVFSPDGNILACVNIKGEATLWNIHTGAIYMELINKESYENSPWYTQNGKDYPYFIINIGEHTINDLSFSPDGTRLATGGSKSGYWNDGITKLWNFTPDITKKYFLYHRTLSGHTSKVYRVNFSPDGKILATKSQNNIKLWNPKKYTLLYSLESNSSGSCLNFSFNHDGSILANINQSFSPAGHHYFELWNLRFDSILHQAIRGQNSKVVDMIIKKFPLLPFIRTPQGQSTLELAQDLQHTHKDGPTIVRLLKDSSGC